MKSIKSLFVPVSVFLFVLYIRSSLDFLEIKPFLVLTLFFIVCAEIRGAVRYGRGGLSCRFARIDLVLLPCAAVFVFPLFVVLQTVKATPVLLLFIPVLLLIFWGGKKPFLLSPSGVFRNIWLPLIVMACICTWWLRYNQFTKPECKGIVTDGCPGTRWINYNAGRNFIFLIPDENYLLSLKCFDFFSDKITVSGAEEEKYPKVPVERKISGGCALAVDSKRGQILIADPLLGVNNIFRKSDFSKVGEFRQYSGRTDTRKYTYHKISYFEDPDIIANISARREISLFSAGDYRHIKTIRIREPFWFPLIYDEYIFSALPLDNRLIMGTWAGELLQFDVVKKKLTKRRWMGLPIQFISKNSTGTRLYAVTLGSRLVTLDAKDLKTLNRVRLPSGARSALVWEEGGRIFTQSYFDGNLYMLSLKDGRIIDKRSVGGGGGPLQIDYRNEMIYIGTECGVFGFKFAKNGFTDKPAPGACMADKQEISWQERFYPTHSLRNLPVTDMSAGTVVIYLHMLWDDLCKQVKSTGSMFAIIMISLLIARHITAGRGVSGKAAGAPERPPSEDTD